MVSILGCDCNFDYNMLNCQYNGVNLPYYYDNGGGVFNIFENTAPVPVCNPDVNLYPNVTAGGTTCVPLQQAQPDISRFEIPMYRSFDPSFNQHLMVRQNIAMICNILQNHPLTDRQREPLRAQLDFYRGMIPGMDAFNQRTKSNSKRFCRLCL